MQNDCPKNPQRQEQSKNARLQRQERFPGATPKAGPSHDPGTGVSAQSTPQQTAALASTFFPQPPKAPMPAPNTPEQAVADTNAIASQSTAEAAETPRTLPSAQLTEPVADAFSRSRSREARCNVCATADGKLSVCYECRDHGCRRCGFWCTLCRRRGYRYFICGRCHDSSAFLNEVQRGKVWACRWCRW